MRSRFRLREANHRQDQNQIASAIQASMDSANAEAAHRDARQQALAQVCHSPHCVYCPWHLPAIAQAYIQADIADWYSLGASALECCCACLSIQTSLNASLHYIALCLYSGNTCDIACMSTGQPQ